MYKMVVRSAAAFVLGVLIANGAAADEEQPAISYGRGGCGKLAGGKKLPCSGKNFEAFAKTGCLLGRTYLHPLVADTIVDAYGQLSMRFPGRTWQFGEMGWENGGRFRPHRSHQNGLSADFFFPVTDQRGHPARVPISIFNKFGYGLDFDDGGRLGELRLDWKAMGAHLLTLDRVGRQRGVRITKVILAVPLRGRLLRKVPRLRRLVDRFNKRQVWVRHDEHYHVDFEIPSKFRRPLACR